MNRVCELDYGRQLKPACAELRVLILDDDPSDVELAEHELRKAGISFVSKRVETRDQFVQALEEFKPEIILASCKLPAFDGRMAVQIARQTHPEVPVVMVTGAMGDEAATELLKAGAKDFVLKNHLGRLAFAVRRALAEEQSIRDRKAAEREVREAEAKYRSLFAEARDGIVLIDVESCRVLDCNAEFERQSGRKLGQLRAVQIWQLLAPEKVEAARKKFFEIKAAGSGGDSTLELQQPDGTIVHIEFSVKVIRLKGSPCIQSSTRDITERKNQEQKIARLNRIHALMSGINSLIVRVRDRQRLFNEACRIAVESGGFGIAWIGVFDSATLGVTPVASAGLDSERLGPITTTARTDVPHGQGTVGRAIRERRAVFCNDITTESDIGGGRRKEAIRRGFRSLIALPFLVEGAVVGHLSLFAREPDFFNEDELRLLNELAGDISYSLEYIAKEEKLNYLAYYDALTGLPNRTLFYDRMAQRLRVASREKSKVALVLIDLQRFRAINDTHGLNIADGLLKQVAQRLQNVMLDRGSLSRVHADVFGALFPGINDEANIARIVEEKIIACLSEPFTLAGQDTRVSAKAGVALFPDDAADPDALFSSADVALKQAKGSSDRYLFYARQMNARVAEQLKLESKLQRALEREQFVLFYQPKVDVRTERVIGLEALVRWNDPDTGLVMPSLFIPLLEDTGMIVEVGTWAMKRAVSQYAAWLAAGLQPPWISVNVSQVQLKRKDFVATVQQAIAIAGVPDHGLDLEITESVIMDDIESTTEKLKIVRGLGVGIAIDDFGTGHSSLRYLTRLPITALKIDRAFIEHMTKNPDDMAVVSAIIALAHTLKLKVIAEGVETEEQSKFLRLLKCDEIQGYLFSKPVPAEQVPALLARGGTLPRAEAGAFEGANQELRIASDEPRMRTLSL